MTPLCTKMSLLDCKAKQHSVTERTAHWAVLAAAVLMPAVDE
jgi:hypothetical protein